MKHYCATLFCALATILPMHGHAEIAQPSPPAANASAEPTTWDKLKSYGHQQKQKALDEANRLMAVTDKKLDELKAQAKASKDNSKTALEQDIATLQSKKDDMKSHMAKLKKSSAAAWAETKEGFIKAHQDLHASFEKSKEAMKQ